MVPLVLSRWYVGYFQAHLEHRWVSGFLLRHPQVWAMQPQPRWHAFMWPGVTIEPASSAFSRALIDPRGFILNEEKGCCQKPQRPQLGLLSVGEVIIICLCLE